MPADTNPDAVKLLSDNEVAEIEARLKVRNEARDLYHDVIRLDSGEADRLIKIMHQWEEHEAPVDVPALCATVRALREKHTQLAEVSGEWAKILDRIRLWSKCEDGYPLDEHINNITTQNTALREQLAQHQETLTALRNCQNKPVCGHCAALLRAATKEQP